ncbi:MAG: hypothetical protein JSV44_08650 [Candidatus Zixiibacteriota bacterium]|nr:MAG: hypothetical protein JSV44_08650 [candidate division Zixibacteria bacterium]
MNRLQVLRKLEATLEHFIARMLDTEASRIETYKNINTLDEIARDSRRGRHVYSRLGDWLARNSLTVHKERLKHEDISRIGSLFNDIQNGLDTADPESKKLSDEIDRWRARGFVPKRKLILKMKLPVQTTSIADRFAELLKKENEYFALESQRSPHLLSVLDEALKSAAAKEDRMYIHLAGAIIYYLKMNGYKIGPYVKRLKEIERLKLNSRDVA